MSSILTFVNITKFMLEKNVFLFNSINVFNTYFIPYTDLNYDK